ncbi:RluA family pseudouridine synthase [Novosphingobium aquiterrae]|uniref:RluA family pseudouridine synthase n=1 Tax=Novosphingobium aquiterrae TaxID=624388 RepID=A0ABV6PJQ3_9SPHN
MIQLPILFEDGEALIINKPAGLSIERPRAGGLSLENYLEALKLGFQRVPVAVHRIDTDTSGCLLLARNPKALKRFNAAFEAREVDKVYLGVVAGAVSGDAGTIDLALSKISSAEKGWRMIAAKKGKPSVTHWRKLAETGGNTLVEFRPETGRTHQIRIHAAEAFGHALLGDPVYGDGKGAKRAMLHALALTVPRGDKPPVAARAPVPADFHALGFGDVDHPA